MKKVFNRMLLLTLLGVAFMLSNCKKDTETITVTKTVYQTDTLYINDTLTVTVHDTIWGKVVSGQATYTDMAGNSALAKGAVVVLYSGSAVDPARIVDYTYADANGNYSFPYLLPGQYFIFARYNTDNTNYRVINGINFETNPGYPVTMGSSNVSQNLSLVNVQNNGNTLIALGSADTTGTNRRKVSFNTHSKVTWESLYNQGNSMTIAGAFNVLTMDKFIFDEANPANTQFNGYILLSSITTFEPARDALNGGCVPKTLKVDTLNSTTPLAITDTARLYTLSVQRYGDGYLARCMMKAFYIHGPSTPQTYTADTTGVPSALWNTTIEKPVDVFFNFEKKKVFNAAGTTFNWEFIFEGKFDFNAKSDFYVVSNNIGNVVTVKPHILMRGDNNTEY